MLLPVLLIALLVSLDSAGSSLIRVNAGCTFHLTTSGGFNGSVGQLANGQARAGSDLAPSLFTWFGDAFVDQQSRGCWWTPPTSVFQCDWNQQPDHGFTIGCYGGVSYRDQSTFYECQTGDGDEVNLYLQPRGVNCSKITLHADSCRPPCAGQSSSAPQATSPATPSPSPTTAPVQVSTTKTGQSSSSKPSSTTSGTPTHTHAPGECDVVVAQGPDEIILIDKGNPDTSYGSNPGMTVQLSPNASAIFVFSLGGTTDVGKACALAFDLPPLPSPTSTTTPQQQLPPPYSLTGSGPVRFALLDGPPADPGNTSWNRAPGIAMKLEAAALAPGVAVRPLDFACPGAGERIAVLIGDEPGADTCLEYSQFRPSVLVGMYVLKC
ncbi:hypothetical protein GGR54DRAFT_629929 [Hypoxylon sp. NC1633]|nr:hypothetical protein GGR54DRAFT_629929 [Hypoxylon sp. NC1633]